MASLHELHASVTNAITEAEQAEIDRLGPGVARAWLKVAQLETEIADQVPVSHVLGLIARLSAIRSTVVALRSLTEAYLAGCPEDARAHILESLSYASELYDDAVEGDENDGLERAITADDEAIRQLNEAWCVTECDGLEDGNTP